MKVSSLRIKIYYSTDGTSLKFLIEHFHQIIRNRSHDIFLYLLVLINTQRLIRMKTNLDSTEPVIVACTISEYPRPMPSGINDKMPSVKVRFDNGEEKILFEFYPDEITFDSKEFLGITEKAAIDLKFEKDKQYLQS